MEFNTDVPLYLGIGIERAEIIQKFTQSIVKSQHSDAERIDKMREAFPRSEELIYAVYLLTPAKMALSVAMTDDPQDKMEDGTDMS